MNDLISRQDALDALKAIPDHNDGMVFETLSHALRDIELLPSAQPEIIMCKDCIHNPSADDNCPLPAQYIMPEGYCHLGEEKDVCNKK